MLLSFCNCTPFEQLQSFRSASNSLLFNKSCLKLRLQRCSCSLLEKSGGKPFPLLTDTAPLSCREHGRSCELWLTSGARERSGAVVRRRNVSLILRAISGFRYLSSVIGSCRCLSFSSLTSSFSSRRLRILSISLVERDPEHAVNREQCQRARRRSKVRGMLPLECR